MNGKRWASWRDAPRDSLRRVLPSLMHLDPGVFASRAWAEWTGDDGATILHYAAAFSTEVTRRLLGTAQGAALIHVCDERGGLPIDCDGLGEERLRMLVCAGSSVECRGKHPGDDNCALRRIISRMHLDAQDHARLLLYLGQGPTRVAQSHIARCCAGLPWSSGRVLQYAEVARRRCQRAARTWVAALAVVRRRVGRDVYRYVMVPALRALWRAEGTNECWEEPSPPNNKRQRL